MMLQFRTAEQIRTLRLNAGKPGSVCTQAQFADRLNVSKRTVIRWEKNGMSWASSYFSTQAIRALEMELGRPGK